MENFYKKELNNAVYKPTQEQVKKRVFKEFKGKTR
jgi:hypothetical protein